MPWLGCSGVLRRTCFLVMALPYSDAFFVRAYERLSLIVATNLPFESWVEIFGCERLTGALLDRLTHRVHIIEANGPSYRLRQSKRRLQKPKNQNDKDDLPDSEKPDAGEVSTRRLKTN